MDEIFAKIDEFTKKFADLKIWALINGLIKTIAEGLGSLGEGEAAGIMEQVWAYGE